MHKNDEEYCGNVSCVFDWPSLSEYNFLWCIIVFAINWKVIHWKPIKTRQFYFYIFLNMYWYLSSPKQFYWGKDHKPVKKRIFWNRVYVVFLNCTLCQRFCGGSCCLWSWIHSWRPWEQTYRKKARISLSGSNKDDDDLHKRKWSVTDSPSFQHTKTIRFIDKSTTKLLLSS